MLRAAPPVVAAALAWLSAAPQSESLRAAVLVGAVAATSDAMLSPHRPRARFLRLVRALYPLAGPAVTLVVLLLLKATLMLPGITAAECLLICVSAAGVGGVIRMIGRMRSSHRRPVRLAIVGTTQTASALAAELDRLPVKDYCVVGYLAIDSFSEPADAARAAVTSDAPQREQMIEHGAGLAFAIRHRLRRSRVRASARAMSGVAPVVPMLGQERDVAAAVKLHRIDLVVLSSDASRMVFFDALASASTELPLRAIELPTFYEDVFGHVPLYSINAAWFQWVMDPAYSPALGFWKRTFDIAVAILAALVTAPFVAIIALLIRRDGGPVLYRQPRIGEGGREFDIIKLRSMRLGGEPREQRWSFDGDDRVTAVGRFLRRTHLDELPQLWNVIRGEMSIVGPRPEQPAFVERLERQVPWYDRRHHIRPGLTGWAQITCGYSGTETGSIWKLSHDLYYLKHRSFGFDCMILVETIGTLFANRQFEDASLPAFISQSARSGALRVERRLHDPPRVDPQPVGDNRAP
ncbi:MAG: exopolysaccharide biosynthesis polyprenyl glycosylphosphotransferase [Candidatus Limnocylindria bacterium]